MLHYTYIIIFETLTNIPNIVINIQFIISFMHKREIIITYTINFINFDLSYNVIEEADEGVLECILNSSMKDFLNSCKHPFIIDGKHPFIIVAISIAFISLNCDFWIFFVFFLSSDHLFFSSKKVFKKMNSVLSYHTRIILSYHCNTFCCSCYIINCNTISDCAEWVHII